MSQSRRTYVARSDVAGSYARRSLHRYGQPKTIRDHRHSSRVVVAGSVDCHCVVDACSRVGSVPHCVVAPCSRRKHRQVNGFFSPQHDRLPMNEACLVHKLCRCQRRNLQRHHVVGSNWFNVAKSELHRHLKLHGRRRCRRRHSVRHTAARNVPARSVDGMLLCLSPFLSSAEPYPDVRRRGFHAAPDHRRADSSASLTSASILSRVWAPVIALRPPSISVSSTMGEAMLLGACLTGLQGLRGSLGWEPAEAAGINNVVPKAITGADIVHREPGAGEPAPTAATTTVRRYDVCSQGAREPAPTEPEKTTVRRHFYHVLSLTIQLAHITVCLIFLAHTHLLYYYTVNWARSCFHS